MSDYSLGSSGAPPTAMSDVAMWPSLLSTEGLPEMTVRISLLTGGHPGMKIPLPRWRATQLPIQSVPSGTSSWPLPIAMHILVSEGK